MLNIILATDINGGIGFKNKLPWNNKEELKIFKDKTIHQVLIMGKRTFDQLSLKNRQIVVVSREKSIEQAIEEATKLSNNGNIWIAGGKFVYEYFFNSDMEYTIHISILNDQYICDTYVHLNFHKYKLIEKNIYNTFTHYVFST